MNFRVLFTIAYIIWVIAVLIQQICWIYSEGYNSLSLIWGIMAICMPYLIFKISDYES